MSIDDVKVGELTQVTALSKVTEPSKVAAPSTVTEPSDFFESLARSDPAPDWLFAGVVRAWRLDPETTTVTMITVSENATFLIAAAGVPVAVTRVARPGYMADAAAFESEVAWVATLAAAGVASVPRGLPTADGAFVAVVPDERGVSWWCVSYSYVAGTILEDVADPVPYYREIGRTTALLHDHAAGWTPPAGFTRHSWELADMVGPTCRWGRWQDVGYDPAALAVVEAAEAAALASLADAPRTAGSWGLIHADLRPSNIMIDADRLTVIDFDDCGFSWFLYDFASALTFMEHMPEAGTMATRWIEGYTEVRALTRADVRLGCDLSMIRRLQMLGWTTTHRQDALPPALWAAQKSGTLEVAARYLRSPTWLID
ncbi:phosphotransferase enzyme family protein [Pengzhenrongella sicca]|uniref:Phosphotransferase n=1 Tax=Pengzhenrongella sicca TaxID=2819238 RepID=A0A8A4ZK70_9MICO|nr:phosphotransferase [Pengzhenrongella sicca]QTE30906.1 phosphotransferase [Pengzhenrongella sicca]